MSRDLRVLLRDAAPTPTRWPDPGSEVRRARRRRAVVRSTVALAAAAVAVGLVLLVPPTLTTPPPVAPPSIPSGWLPVRAGGAALSVPGEWTYVPVLGGWDVAVHLCTGERCAEPDQAQLDHIQTLLRSHPGTTFTYESQAEAYSRFRDAFAGWPFAETVEPDALPASFRITLTHPDRSHELVALAANQPGVEDVTRLADSIQAISCSAFTTPTATVLPFWPDAHACPSTGPDGNAFTVALLAAPASSLDVDQRDNLQRGQLTWINGYRAFVHDVATLELPDLDSLDALPSADQATPGIRFLLVPELDLVLALAHLRDSDLDDQILATLRAQ